MKKLVYLLLTLTLVLTMLLPLPVMAADSNTFTIGSAEGQAGDTVKVGLEISDNPGVVGFSLKLEYDSNVIEFIGAEAGDVFYEMALPNGTTIKSSDLEILQNEQTLKNNPIRINYTSGVSEVKNKSLVVTLVAKIKENAPAGKSALKLTFDSAYTKDLSPVTFETVSGSVNVVCEHTYGGWTTVDNANHAKTCSKCQDKITEAHKWDDGKVTTPATHTKEGVKTYTCSVCGETKTESIPVTTEHNYGEWTSNGADTHSKKCECNDIVTENHTWNAGEVTTAATHTKEGVKTFACTACGETKTESIPVTTEHSYGDWASDGADTHSKKCECGNTVSEAHKWDDGKVTASATHDKEGTKTYNCTVCGETKTEKLPVIADHMWGEGSVTTAPTHTKEGVKTYTCSVCGETKTESIPVTTEHTYGEWASDGADTHSKKCECGDTVTEAHKWDDGKVTTPATHEEDGVATYTCVCGETKTESIKAVADCVWDEGEVTTAPTHTKKGEKTYTCSICGETKTEEIPATTEHTFEGEWITDGNGHKQACECGVEDEVAAHTFGDWKVTKEATETEKGSKERACTVCEYTETEEIDQLPATPSEPNEPEVPKVPEVPKTGDATIVFVAMAGIAGIAAVVLTNRKKRAN